MSAVHLPTIVRPQLEELERNNVLQDEVKASCLLARVHVGRRTRHGILEVECRSSHRRSWGGHHAIHRTYAVQLEQQTVRRRRKPVGISHKIDLLLGSLYK